MNRPEGDERHEDIFKDLDVSIHLVSNHHHHRHHHHSLSYA